MPAPSLSLLSPSSVTAGTAGVSLVVNGAGFLSGCQIYWGTHPLVTSVNSATQVSASVSTGLLAAAGTVNVTVLQGGAVSNPLVFAVPSAPATYDLTTLSDLKGYLMMTFGSTTVDDFVLQLLVTAASQFIVNRTRRDADLYSAAAFVNERYDGNNQDYLIPYHYPVQSVQSLMINNSVVVQTPDYIQPGYAINQQKDRIILIAGNGGGLSIPNFYWRQYGGLYFYRGRLNIALSYTAGYSSVPADLEEAALELIGQNYRRRGWIDEASRALPQGGGTQSFRQWEMPPKTAKAIRYYSRVAPY